MIATNYIGAFVLTKLLLPLLESSPVSSKIVNVTSFTHRAGRNNHFNPCFLVSVIIWWSHSDIESFIKYSSHFLYNNASPIERDQALFFSFWYAGWWGNCIWEEIFEFKTISICSDLWVFQMWAANSGWTYTDYLVSLVLIPN